VSFETGKSARALLLFRRFSAPLLGQIVRKLDYCHAEPEMRVRQQGVLQDSLLELANLIRVSCIAFPFGHKLWKEKLPFHNLHRIAKSG
jgi:hypothetical protein